VKPIALLLFLLLEIVGAAIGLDVLPARVQARAGTLFEDDFETGLSKWDTYGVGTAAVRASGHTAHGNVLVLVPNGDAYALAKGSDRFGPLRIEGDVFFPDNSDSYLGVVYNFGRRAHRTDFGAIYIKGNDSYLQVNPHRDFGVSRALYPEFRVALTGAAAIRTAQWQQFAVEVVENAAHFYVGGSPTPQLTFSGFERRSGAIGLQPRSIGGDVWIDNIRVIAIERLSYAGPPIPAVRPDRSELLTEWTVAGPFTAGDDSLAQSPERHARQWRPFETDDRGAVVSGRVVDYHGPNTVAYYRTRVRSETDRRAELRLSTVDDLAIWLNGRLHSHVARGDAAWFDFLQNPSRKPQSIPLELKAGINELVLRVRGGVYASGGFFAAVVTGT
jgi:hypothetical protein